VDLLEEGEQWEAVKAWLKENGLAIVGGALLGTLALFGWRWWQSRAESQHLAANVAYEKLLGSFDAGDTEGALKSLDQFRKDFAGSAYAALDAFTIEGVRYNIPFLASLMQHPRWKEGKLSTAFIAEEYPDGFHASKPEGETAKTLAAVAAAMDHVLGERKRKISGQLIGRLVMREKQRLVRLGELEIGLEIMRQEDAIGIRFLSGNRTDTQVHFLHSHWRPGERVWAGTIDGKEISVQVRAILNGFALAWRGIETKAHVYTGSEAALARLMPVKASASSGKRRC